MRAPRQVEPPARRTRALHVVGLAALALALASAPAAALAVALPGEAPAGVASASFDVSLAPTFAVEVSAPGLSTTSTASIDPLPALLPVVPPLPALPGSSPSEPQPSATSGETEPADPERERRVERLVEPPLPVPAPRESIVVPRAPTLVDRANALVVNVLGDAHVLVTRWWRVATPFAGGPESSEARAGGAKSDPPALAGDLAADPTTAASLAAVAGFSLVAAAGAASGSWLGLGEKLRRLLFLAPAIPGFTRLAPGTALENAERARLYDLVRAAPGITLAGIAAASEIGRTAIVHHLRVLEREGLVSSRREGRTRHYFEAGRARVASPAAYAALGHETARALARAVGEKPGLDQKAVCEAFNLRPSLAYWHLSRLENAGIVAKTRDGRHVRYGPGPAFASFEPVIRA